MKRRDSTEWAIVPWYFARRAATFEWHATNSAHVALTVAIIRVSSIPAPLRDRVPLCYVDFHECSDNGSATSHEIELLEGFRIWNGNFASVWQLQSAVLME